MYPSYTQVQLLLGNKKEGNMREILRDLENKQNEAAAAKEELEGIQYDLRDNIDSLTDYIDEVQNLIDSLTELPTVSVSVSLDVEFEA